MNCDTPLNIRDGCLLATPLQTDLQFLAHLFEINFGTLSGWEMKVHGFDVDKLLQRGWIVRCPGRWSNGFAPAGDLESEYFKALIARARRAPAVLPYAEVQS